ncbi:MAG: hypothetical protein WCI10_03405 [Actinomycetota bacterium]|jgi:hypothetical protein
MRYFFAARLWAALGILLGASALVFGILVVVNGGSSSSGASTHVIDVVAAVTTTEFGDGWQVTNGKSVGDATIALDDGRTMHVVDGTPGEVTCQLPTIPYSCVFVADTLGSGVLWFALVPSDSSNGKEILTLPALVDMLNGGDLGVLSNGWVVPLATPTVRKCDTDTTSLRDFINKFPDGNAISLLNLYQDRITEVVCTGP